jgi:hypothetical protein
MAKKKQNGATAEPEASAGILTAAAKVIGTAAGKIASVVKPSNTATPRRGKFVKTNKSRLPRKLKKSRAKSAAKEHR